MAELEALTKTLIQVVGSLQDMLTKKSAPQSSLEPEVPRLKKTADMTYSEFIKKALSSKKPLEVNSKKLSYRLQEDLELLEQLSHHQQISIKTFEEISNSKRVHRTAESLKSRYHDYLYIIDEKEMKKIVNWIEKEGVEGFLIFESGEMKIQLNDPKEGQDRKRHRPAGQDAESKKHEKSSKGSRLKNIPSNCRELSDVLKLYSKMVNVSVKTLTERLDQLSGDLVALDNYIETKDARLLWTAEEDEILKKGGP